MQNRIPLTKKHGESGVEVWTTTLGLGKSTAFSSLVIQIDPQ